MPYKDYEKRKENSRKNYYKNREKKLKYAKDYYQENKEDVEKVKKAWNLKNIEKVRKYRREYYAKYSMEKKKVHVKKWESENGHKKLCHHALYNALRRGDIMKPNKCSICGKTGMIHGHHSDYEKPFDVKWLCPVCHRKEHVK